jgi:hypothetical protein
MAQKEYPMGMKLIEAGECPIGSLNPLACWHCPYGHATECHHPHTCDECKCSHYTELEEFDESDLDYDEGYPL